MTNYSLSPHFTLTASGFIDTGRYIEFRSIATRSQIAIIHDDGRIKKWHYAQGTEFEDNQDKIKVVADNFDLFWFALKNSQKRGLETDNLFYDSNKWKWNSETKHFSLK